MQRESLGYKIWQIIYPVLLYFLLDLLMVWAIQYLLSPRTPDGSMVFEPYSTTIASIVFLAVSIGVMYYFFHRDRHPYATWIYKKPGYLPLILVIGALASHGLSALVSLLQLDQILGNYTQIEQTVFGSPWPLVVLQVVILTPISEELIFRGLLFKRLEKYTGRFWVAAVISSAVFGIAHWNLAQGLFAFLFGLLACLVYESVRNLWASIVLHLGGNLISVILVYTGAEYPSTALYIIGMVLALAISFALYFFLIRPIGKKTEKEMA